MRPTPQTSVQPLLQDGVPHPAHRGKPQEPTAGALEEVQTTGNASSHCVHRLEALVGRLIAEVCPSTFRESEAAAPSALSEPVRVTCERSVTPCGRAMVVDCTANIT